MKACPLCSKETDEKEMTCSCGHKFEDEPQKAKELQEEYESPVLQKRKKKGTAIKAVVLVLCLVAGVVGGFFVSTYFSKARWSEKFDPILVVENDKIVCLDAARPKAEPILIANLEGETEDLYFYYEHYMSPDNKQILYSNNYVLDEENYESTFDLYLYNLELQQQQVKIATGVSYFYVNEAFDTVTCLKGEGKNAELYQYDMMGHETVVTESVEMYNISADGSTIIYQTFEGEIYVYTKGAEPVLINKNSYLINVSEDFSGFIYVTKKGNLIKYNLAQSEKTVIDEGVDYDDCLFYLNNGKGYYTKPGTAYNLADYLEDDMLESDKAIDYSSDEYESRLMRDSIRQELSDEEYNTVSLDNIYYYDGEKNSLVDKNVSMFFTDDNFNCDSGVYVKPDGLKLQKVKMSEIAPLLETGDIYSFEDYFFGYTDVANESFYVCNGSKKTDKIEDVSIVDGVAYNSEENAVYFYGSDEDASFTSVYKAKCSGKTMKEIELVDDKIDYYEVYYTKEGNCFYIKNQSEAADNFDYEEPCDLYLNGNVVKEGIYGYIHSAEDGWIVAQEYEKNEDGEYVYTIFDDEATIVFTCPQSIDETYAERTEKGRYIIIDGERLVIASGKKVKTVEGISDDCYLPEYPSAAIDETNFDYSDLNDFYEDYYSGE